MASALSSMLTNLCCFALALGLFAGFGPPLPLPGNPNPQRIVDLNSEQLPLEARPLEGVLAPNDALLSAVVLFNETIRSSESVSVEPDGSLVLMDKYGFVYKAAPDASQPGGYRWPAQPITRLGLGRPLGFRKHPVTGHYIICVAGMGLVELQMPDEATGTPAKTVLLGAYVSSDSPVDPDTSIQYANALDITPDGSVIYFTDSQLIPVTPNYGVTRQPWYDTFGSFLLGLFSGQPTGRLMAYYPHNGTIHVLAKGLYYSNGVALSEDGSYLAVAETNAFRVLRYWIKGDKAGQLEVLVDRLPAFPDGVSRALDGKGFWVALPAPRQPIHDMMYKWRILRAVAAYLPSKFRPKVGRMGAVVLVNPEGQITQFLQDQQGKHTALISSVEEHALSADKTRLWIASVSHHYIAYLDLPRVPQH